MSNNEDYEQDGENETLQNLVIDIGTGLLKCGFAGDDGPRAIFKNMIGKPRSDSVGLVHGSSGGSGQKVFVGEEAANNAGVLDITYVCENGIVQSREALECVLEQAIVTELRVSPSDYNVLLTEAPLNPDKNRIMMMELCFDTIKVAGAQVQIQAVLALYASGRTTGLVFDSGDGVSHTVPVFKGYGIKHAVGSSKVAGREVSQQVLNVLSKESDVDLRNESNGLEIAREIKENICRVALNYEEELAKIKEDESLGVKYVLKDGSEIVCRELVLTPPEILFKPDEFGLQRPSLRAVLNKTIQGVNIDTRKEFFNNTVLSGGTTCLKDYVPRFEKEYKEIVPQIARSEIKITTPPDRTVSVFIGGSILATLATFQQQWITAEEWAENGTSIISRKRLF